MYADSTPVVASAPSCTRRSWPPAPAPREPIVIEPAWDGDASLANAVPVPRPRRPHVTRTYITADGVVRETEERVAPAPVRVAPLAPRQDGPRIVRFEEEV